MSTPSRAMATSRVATNSASADLNRALRDDAIDAIWCLRGGYGAMRILDVDRLRRLPSRRPKPIIGYSDITALHSAFAQRSEMVTYHGPTARAVLSPFSRRSLACALVHGGDSCGDRGRARAFCAAAWRHGMLAGGNLALLSALAGTPFAPRLGDAILVLEDIDEPVYRIDRMMRQLLLAGLLDGVRGIVFGTCTELSGGRRRRCPKPRRRRSEKSATLLGVPTIIGAPVGHIDDQWTLPLGAPGVARRRPAHPRRPSNPNDRLIEPTDALQDRDRPRERGEAADPRIHSPRSARDAAEERGGDLPRRPRAERVEPRSPA